MNRRPLQIHCGRIMTLYGALFCIIFLLLGCNVPEPPIVEEPRIGMLYDTKYEQQALSGKPQPRILDGIWEPYFETLAEPVCVTQWRNDHSVWEILFATNRGQQPSTDESLPHNYSNRVLSQPTFGRSLVQVPHRKRGQEPVRQTSGKNLFASRAKEQQSATSSDGFALLQTVNSIPSVDFRKRLLDQISRSRQKDVLLFVHGFNVDFESCLIRTAQLGLDIPFNGALVAYSWPTQGSVLKYESDEPINEVSVVPFSQFLAWMIEILPDEAKLKIVVHSMGSRIVLKGINQLSNVPHDTKLIETLCLCAPDVGVSDYRSLIPGVVSRCNRVVLYANNSDGALKISKSLHLEQRTGDARLPATMQGVDLIDCSAVDLSFLGHSYFSGNESVLTDLFCVLKENKSPGQCPHLKRQQTSSGDEYWTFSKHPHRILWSWNFDDRIQ